MDNRQLSPDLERLLTQVPEEDIRLWLAKTYPELVRAQEEKRAKGFEALRQLKEMSKQIKPLRDPLEVLREIREGDHPHE